jgi:osmotically-inducible protein OsmY
VSYVENNLVVSPTKPSDDHRLLALAQDALANYPPGDPTTIGVRAVESGQAYITGTAEHAAEARRAMEIVESVPGIRRVIDEIVIAPGVPIDEVDLMNNVLDRFNTDPRLHTAGIVIDADRGTVYLSGEVQNEDMAESAGELASQARGVQHVINRLRVVR